MEGYLDALESAAVFDLPGWTVLEFRGADRETWLQGQVTADLLGHNGNGSIGGCWCKPTGQIESFGCFWKQDDKVLFLTQQPEPALDRINTSVILEDVTASQVAYPVSATFGPESAGDLPLQLLSVNGHLHFHERPSAPQLGQGAFECLTLEAGTPLAGVDVADRTLPPELGPNFESNYVSYSKGCYTGQEVLERIAARGRTNWIWRGLRLPSRPTALEISSEQKAAAGQITRVSESPRFGWIAGSRLRREAAEVGTIVTVGELEAEVVEFPFSAKE